MSQLAGRLRPHGSGGWYSSEVQQRPHGRTRSGASRCVRTSRQRGHQRLLRGVRDEEITCSNPVTDELKHLVKGTFRLSNFDPALALRGSTEYLSVPLQLQFYRAGADVSPAPSRSGRDRDAAVRAHGRRPPNRRLSKTSPLTSAVTQVTPASEAVYVRVYPAHASAWVGEMSGAPWGSLNLQVDRGQLGS
jgi:hypothetical protein